MVRRAWSLRGNDCQKSNHMALGYLCVWLKLSHLILLNDAEDPTIRYYSGTAGYTATSRISPDLLTTAPDLFLDLGDVHDIAEVLLNQQNVGIVWRKPYRVNVKNVLRPGNNEVEIRVTNSWLNRLIGDSQPATMAIANSAGMRRQQSGASLQPSGLQGPVQLSKFA